MSPCDNNLHDQLNYNFHYTLPNKLVILTIVFLSCMHELKPCLVGFIMIPFHMLGLDSKKLKNGLKLDRKSKCCKHQY